MVDVCKMRNFRAGPSSRSASMSVSAVHGANHSTRHRNSIMASTSSRSFSRASGAKSSRASDKCAPQTPKQLVRVFDDDNNDVTPVPLYQTEPAAVRSKVTRFFLDEISVGSASYHTSVAGSLSTPFSRSLFGSTRISSPAIESINEDIDNLLSKRDFIHYAEVHWISDTATEKVTEEMLKEVIDIYFTETESVSLLDIPNTFVSVDSEGADAVIQRNRRYAEICSSRMGNNKYVDRAMQTLNEPVKNKHIQSDCVVMVDTGTTATTWDLYDSLLSVDHHESASAHDLELVDFHEAAADISKTTDLSFSLSSTASSASTASSMNEVKTVNIECELQQVLQSEHFHNHLQIMERTILENVMQPKLAAYRQLPVLTGVAAKPGSGEDAQGVQGVPSLECLWTFTCELTKGCSVTSMVWNKRNPDLLAVGYGEFDLSYQNPGLVCCWSLKNHTWPDRYIHCDYAVTCLDFSPNNPSQLAVGMINGTIAIYDVQTLENKTCVVSSCECYNKHMGPVWELKWIQQEVTLTGDEKVEALFSVAADGRICKWLLCNNGLDCIDLMKLNRVLPTKRRKMEQKAESVLSAVTSGLCFDFHPTDCSIYLVGTFEGLVHQGSSSNTQHFLEIYRKHSCPVNCLAWSPFNDEAFLSGSSDWTIQLWRRDQSQPVMSFISTQRAVVDIKWSPKKATVFATIKEEVLEIWDLSTSILDPVIVKEADPGVQLKALLIAAKTDCVLVGDSDGQVTVYKIQNLKVGGSNPVDILDGIIG